MKKRNLPVTPCGYAQGTVASWLSGVEAKLLSEFGILFSSTLLGRR